MRAYAYALNRGLVAKLARFVACIASLEAGEVGEQAMGVIGREEVLDDDVAKWLASR